jgi:hypothetical protein
MLDVHISAHNAIRKSAGLAVERSVCYLTIQTRYPSYAKIPLSFLPQRFLAHRCGYLIVSTECKLLRKSLGGGYHFKRVAIGAGQERFRDAPNKNEHSHIGDAFGYLLLGGGEHRRMTKTPLGVSGQFVGQAQAETEFNIFG